jgi:hypothetical protein
MSWESPSGGWREVYAALDCPPPRVSEGLTGPSRTMNGRPPVTNTLFER